MGRAVRLNPIVVLVSVLVGYDLLGLAGALFAVPVAAALAVVVDELHDQRLLDEQNAATAAREIGAGASEPCPPGSTELSTES
jgi:predicted PurR-regulated permease PerM